MAAICRFFITALLLTLVSMSIFRSPAVSLMPDVTPKPLRSKGNAIINLMGAVGVILALGLVMVLVGDGQDAELRAAVHRGGGDHGDLASGRAF